MHHGLSRCCGQSIFPKLLPEKNGGSESCCLRDEVVVTTHVIKPAVVVTCT